MKLLCDEDIGTKVPEALHIVGYDARSLVRLGLGGSPDVQWLQQAGQGGWLALSCNKKQLSIAQERRAILDNDVGIVYLTTGEEQLPKVLRLLLTKWEALSKLDAEETRPFARFLSPNGRLAASYRGLSL